MKKTRSDAKLDHLPEEQKAQVIDWLLAGLPYHKVRELIREQFAVATSIGALSGFYQREAVPVLLARRRRAAGVADEIAAEARKAPGAFDEATIDALRQKVFELALAPGADAREIKALFSLVLKARDQDLEARRVALLEKKAAQADEAAKVTADTALSPEEKARKYREIFGLQ